MLRVPAAENQDFVREPQTPRGAGKAGVRVRSGSWVLQGPLSCLRPNLPRPGGVCSVVELHFVGNNPCLPACSTDFWIL